MVLIAGIQSANGGYWNLYIASTDTGNKVEVTGFAWTVYTQCSMGCPVTSVSAYPLNTGLWTAIFNNNAMGFSGSGVGPYNAIGFFLNGLSKAAIDKSGLTPEQFGLALMNGQNVGRCNFTIGGSGGVQTVSNYASNFSCGVGKSPWWNTDFVDIDQSLFTLDESNILRRRNGSVTPGDVPLSVYQVMDDGEERLAGEGYLYLIPDGLRPTSLQLNIVPQTLTRLRIHYDMVIADGSTYIPIYIGDYFVSSEPPVPVYQPVIHMGYFRKMDSVYFEEFDGPFNPRVQNKPEDVYVPWELPPIPDPPEPPDDLEVIGFAPSSRRRRYYLRVLKEEQD